MLLPVFCFSQKLVFGIKAGLALSNSTIIDPVAFYTNNTKTRTGLLGGVYVDISGRRKIIFRSGAEVVSKGSFTFVDFPVSVLYKTNCTKGHVIAGGGPSIGIPIRDYYSTYPLKTEFGVNGLIGYEMPIGFSLNLNYSYGLSNASKEKECIKISNRYLGVTVGYSF